MFLGGTKIVRVSATEQVIVSGYTIDGEPTLDTRLQVGTRAGYRDTRRYYKMTPDVARALAEALYDMADRLEEAGLSSGSTPGIS